MQELVKATGVRKSTILFYLAQGLLPPPLAVGPNSAVYDTACVERVRLIRSLQADHRLTLAEIRAHLAGGATGHPAAVFPRLQATTAPPADTGKRLDRTAFCRATGLRQADADEFARAGVLRPLQPESFDADDVAVGRVCRDALAAGLRPRDLSVYAEIGETIAAAEMALRTRLAGRRSTDADAAARLNALAYLCRTYVVDRIFQERIAAMKSVPEEEPTRPEREREPWLD
ncbi:MAG: MerR family transcriptional regulator [Desulfobacterales bacterium]|nr:MerR family transcriptional regulator [Desulfobacterales bacterium]